MAEIRHIVVGVDGSGNAQHALEWAVALARPVDARVTAVHALGLLDRLGDAPVPSAAHRDEIVDEFSRVWCVALDDAGVPNERLVIDGPPADVILRAAADGDADLIVVGERGIGGGPASELGSTSRRVLAEADRPVLVVPAP
jgi:nucleotide-binding universal stress UspA family protein